MKVVYAIFLFFSLSLGYAQNRFIEVTGSAEMEIQPDEIRFIIRIQEYWKEEFEKKTEFKDYKTKVTITEIENQLLTALNGLGISKENIITQEVGNYWRYQGKEFLIAKQYELIIDDFNKIDEIVKNVKVTGIDFMKIGDLKHKDLTEYRKQVKIEAIKAAKNKAQYLLGSIDQKVGNIISVQELAEDNNNTWSGSNNEMSNMVLNSNQNSGDDNVRKIKLRYQIKTKFEIE